MKYIFSFNGTGKTYISKHFKNVFDYDSSLVSYNLDTAVKMADILKYNLFLCCKFRLFDIVNTDDIVTVIPSINMKDEIINRCADRNNRDLKFWQNYIETNFDYTINKVTDICNRKNIKIYTLKPNQYLLDVLKGIEDVKFCFEKFR